MYKQIFKPPIDTIDTNIEDIKDYLKDEMLMSRSVELTKIMIDANININTITAIVKEYQQKYIYIKKNAPELTSAFTPIIWWKTRR